MRRLSWENRLALVLVSISVLVYGLKYLILGAGGRYLHLYIQRIGISAH